MPKVREWTEGEIDRLKLLYPSDRSFEEIVDEFPRRSPNAVRLKASRLGLRRPTFPPKMYEAETVIRCSEVNGGNRGYILRCSGCGSWVQVVGDVDEKETSVTCDRCGSTYILTS